MTKRYRVTLTPEERDELKALTPRALLLCDASEGGPAGNVADVAEALGITSRTIEHLKKSFVEQGLEAALVRKPRTRPPRDSIFDGKFEAQLVALACSEAPEGSRRWTVRL